MRFRRQGGRKRILDPDGSDLAPPSRAQPDSTLVKALARAWRWQRQIDSGVHVSLAEIAAAEKLSNPGPDAEPERHPRAAGEGGCRSIGRSIEPSSDEHIIVAGVR
jgi:hypothetical protein